MKTRILAMLILLGLVILVTGCPPTKKSKKQPKDTPVTVVVGPNCGIKIVDTVKNSGGLTLWKSRPVTWKNTSDKVVVAEFGGEPLLAGRKWVRLNPGEWVTTRVSSRMPNGRYKYVIKCIKNRDDKDDEDEKSEDEYDVEEPPPDIIEGDGP